LSKRHRITNSLFVKGDEGGFEISPTPLYKRGE